MSTDGIAAHPGRLAAAFAEGRFAITAETTPPLTTDPMRVVERTAPLAGLVEAVNVTDGAGARAHLASSAAAYFMTRENGIEAVLQFTTRDRNTLALERDLIGATAFAIPNILCLSGDPVERGDAPEAKAVNDLDSTGLVALAVSLRDEGRLPSGREITPPPAYLVGAADAPLDPSADWRPNGLAAKVAAGASFVQTQFCFDMELLERYLARLAEAGLLPGLKVLVGIAALTSARQGAWMRDNLFGTIIPDAVLSRLEGADDPSAEGRRIAGELLHRLKATEGVAGAHLMGPSAEAQIAQAIEESGVR